MLRPAQAEAFSAPLKPHDFDGGTAAWANAGALRDQFRSPGFQSAPEAVYERRPDRGRDSVVIRRGPTPT